MPHGPRVRPSGQRLIRAARALPVHLNEAKAQVRVESSFTDDDTILTHLIRTATERAEEITSRVFCLEQWEAYFDWSFPRVIQVPHAPLRSVDAIEYVDTAGATQTVATSTYTVDDDSEPGRIFEAWNESWPTTRTVRQAVTLRYTVGYLVPFADSDVDTGADTITATDHPYADTDPLELSNSGGTLPAELAADTPYFARGVSGDDLQVALTSGGSEVDITTASGGGTHFLGRAPDPLRHALLLMIAQLYRFHEMSVTGTIVTDLDKGPVAAEGMLANQRMLWV